MAIQVVFFCPRPLKLLHRYEWLVSFDNNNAPDEASPPRRFSYTLAVKHKAYAASPRGGCHARVFMIEVEDCAAPNTALQWLLDELVEDNDLVVCVHIADGTFRLAAGARREEARLLLESIVAKVHGDRALSVILEFAGGSVTHSDFMDMVRGYDLFLFSFLTEAAASY